MTYETMAEYKLTNIFHYDDVMELNHELSYYLEKMSMDDSFSFEVSIVFIDGKRMFEIKTYIAE